MPVTLPAGFVNTVTTNNNTNQSIDGSTSVPNNTLATDTAEGSLFATSSAILQPLQQVTATASVNGLGHATAFGGQRGFCSPLHGEGESKGPRRQLAQKADVPAIIWLELFLFLEGRPPVLSEPPDVSASDRSCA
jgi:hypothetical protein